jgi:peptide deformylase
MNLEFVPETSPILMQECKEFDFNNPPFDPKEFAQALHNKMIKSDGLGLSANQVGQPYRVFVMRTGEKPYAVFNPRVVDVSDKELSMKEGCLSFPLLYLNVKRPDSVRIRFQDETGETRTEKFSGMTARIVLHEFDHMLGKVYTQKASAFETQRAMRKRTILKRKAKRI